MGRKEENFIWIPIIFVFCLMSVAALFVIETKIKKRFFAISSELNNYSDGNLPSVDLKKDVIILFLAIGIFILSAFLFFISITKFLRNIKKVFNNKSEDSQKFHNNSAFFCGYNENCLDIIVKNAVNFSFEEIGKSKNENIKNALLGSIFRGSVIKEVKNNIKKNGLFSGNYFGDSTLKNFSSFNSNEFNFLKENSKIKQCNNNANFCFAVAEIIYFTFKEINEIFINEAMNQQRIKEDFLTKLGNNLTGIKGELEVQDCITRSFADEIAHNKAENECFHCSENKKCFDLYYKKNKNIDVTEGEFGLLKLKKEDHGLFYIFDKPIEGKVFIPMCFSTSRKLREGFYIAAETSLNDPEANKKRINNYFARKIKEINNKKDNKVDNKDNKEDNKNENK